MQARTAAAAIVAAAALGAAAAGCRANNPAYFPAASVLQAEGDGVEVSQTLALRFRAPSANEQAQLDTMTGRLGYPAPWLRQDSVHVELKYTVTNLGDEGGIFSLFVDGATEFTRFDYAAVAAAFEAADQDAPPIGVIQVSNPPLLAQGQTYQGIVREDDFREASLDLDAMGRFMAPFVSVLINRSEVNAIGLEMVPSNMSPPREWVLPALWEVTVRFSANRPMTCQFIVRVRDDEGRLWEDGVGEFVPAPTTFMPTLP